MNKKMFAFILPIVLVIGTAFGAGLVMGDWEPCTADTTVEIEVEYEKPTIDVCNVPYFYVECDEDIVIPYDDEGVKISSLHHEPVEVTLEVWSDDYEEGQQGDAGRYAISDTIYVEAENYEDGQAYVGWTFELGDYPFWVEGEWKLKGTMEYCEDFGDTGNVRTDQKTAFEVEKCCQLDATSELYGEGKPGETVTMDGYIEKLCANFAWELSAEDFYLENENGETLTGVVTYWCEDGEEWVDYLTGDPMCCDNDPFEFRVQVEIPVGTYPGTFEGTATHTLAQQ